MKEVWYLVGESNEITKSKIVSFLTEKQEIVLFRNSENEVIALEAHCSHLGANLKSGRLSTEGIICPLHQICFQSNGKSKPSSFGQYEQKKFKTKERFGSVFVYIGEEPEPVFPDLSLIPEDKQMVATFGTQKVMTTQDAILVNAFDPYHLEFVHKRKLMGCPSLHWDKKNRILEFQYTSQVIGYKLSDRIMKWISKNQIQVRIRSFNGHLFTIESDLGKVKSQLLLSLNPFPTYTLVSGILVQKKTFPVFNFLRMKLAGFLFRRFLLADLKPLEGMKLQMDHLKQDPYFRVIADCLEIMKKE